MNKANIKKRRKVNAEEKWQVYQECQQPGAKIGEILRKHKMFSSDLQNIRRIVEQSALEGFRQCRPGRKKIITVSEDEHERLKKELSEKEKALADITVMFTSLKKKVNLE